MAACHAIPAGIQGWQYMECHHKHSLSSTGNRTCVACTFLFDGCDENNGQLRGGEDQIKNMKPNIEM